MKTTHLFTAIALTIAAAAGPVMAQEATYEYPQAAVSQVTRSAVLADLKLARDAGELLVNEASVGHETGFVAQRGRDAVRAEARDAVRGGETAAWTAEPYGFGVDTPKSAAPTTVAAR